MPPRARSLSSVRASLDSEESSSSYSTRINEEDSCVQSSHDPHRLGIIFDLDGTLVAESSDPEQSATDQETFIRPAVLGFLRWCRTRNHVVAVWTAAHGSWAHYVTWKICSTLDPQHDCQGLECRKLFSFVWTADHMVRRARIPMSAHGEVAVCCWCEQYRHTCERCTCHSGAMFACPCRDTKDLSKVWKKHKIMSAQQQHQNAFTRERTIIIENTPQQCVRNYGNAVYVPSYKGNAHTESNNAIFERLQELVLQFEQARDVRTVSRCSHGTGAHACFQQSWWRMNPSSSSDMMCRPVGETSSCGNLL